MAQPRKYENATAFRRALEDRLSAIAKKENADLQRLRREVSFDRFLARLFASSKSPWVLKGGYAMEIRFKEARATKDVDLMLKETLGVDGRGKNTAIRETLQQASALDMEDFFEFLIGEPMMDLDAAPYGGARYPADTRMDGRSFVRFHVDIAMGDAVVRPLESLQGRDWLGFARIPAPKFTAVSKEQQFSEKLHAYTLPRQVPNSRVRDLVDLLLLIQEGKLDKQGLGEALRATFERRKTHSLPKKLDPPPKDWDKPFSEMARECGIKKNCTQAFEKVAVFFAGLG